MGLKMSANESSNFALLYCPEERTWRSMSPRSSKKMWPVEEAAGMNGVFAPQGSHTQLLVRASPSGPRGGIQPEALKNKKAKKPQRTPNPRTKQQNKPVSLEMFCWQPGGREALSLLWAMDLRFLRGWASSYCRLGKSQSPRQAGVRVQMGGDF